MALLVVGYREPEVLRAAIPFYRAAGWDVFIHLDAKADIVAYRARLGEVADSCLFIDARENVFWGGFSMVKAEIALILAAIKHAPYDRFTLVSDDTFPILSVMGLETFFSNDLERITIRKLSMDEKSYARYAKYFFFDHPAIAIQGRTIEGASIDANFFNDLARLQAVMARGKSTIDVYIGSQWWSLTRKTLEKILDELEKNEQLLHSFMYSAVPDEIMFQSLVGALAPRDQIRIGPVYVDWTRTPKPFIFQRPVDVESAGTAYAFARKFSREASEAYLGLASKIAG